MQTKTEGKTKIRGRNTKKEVEKEVSGKRSILRSARLRRLPLLSARVRPQVRRRYAAGSPRVRRGLGSSPMACACIWIGRAHRVAGAALWQPDEV